MSILNFPAQADINKDTREIINIFKELRILSYGQVIMMLPKLRKLALGTFTESRHAGWLVILDFSCWLQPWFIFGPYLGPVFSFLFNGTSAT